MNSLNIFSVRALIGALEQIHSTMDLASLPEALYSALRGLMPTLLHLIAPQIALAHRNAQAFTGRLSVRRQPGSR